MTTTNNPYKDAVRKARKKPEWFVRSVLRNKKSDPWQIELIEAVFDVKRKQLGLPTVVNHQGLNRFSIVSCHGTGKTTAVAMLMHAFEFTRRAKIIVTAPKQEQVTTRVWPAFRGLLANSIDAYKDLVNPTATRICWAGNENWCALVETANSPENMAGHHPSVDVPELMFIVEEASGVKDEMFPPMEGALTTEGAILVMISNPTKCEGEFWRSHCKPGTMEQYYKLHISPENSSFVSPAWVKSMISKYGRTSPVVKIRCLGEFADVSPNQLIPIAWIDDAKKPVPEGDGSFPRLRVSVDVADGGTDETVITAALHYDSFVVVLAQERHSFEAAVAPLKSAYAAIDMAKRYGYNAARGDDFVVDALGCGSGCAGRLIELGYPTVIYKGGEASDDSEQWRNRRTQSHICMRDAFRDKTVVLSETMYEDPADWEDLEGQMASIRTRPGTERHEELVTKEQMKKEGLKSPDMAESLAMQWATQTPTIGSGSDGEFLSSESQALDDMVGYV